jgi:CspA family cold shock protein
MATGTVKFFNTDRGFSFITPEGGGPDVFVHKSLTKQTGAVQVSKPESFEKHGTKVPSRS